MALDGRSYTVIHEALADFGYTMGKTRNEAREYVRVTTDKLLNGEKPVGGPAFFIHGWLRKAGYEGLYAVGTVN